MKSKVLLLGSTGGIGSEVKRLLEHNNYDLYCFDLRKNNIKDILSTNDFNVIINCVGTLDYNNQEKDYKIVFDPNFGITWDIVRFFIDSPPNIQTNILVLGSSSYNQGKKNYMLYSASKAALNNLIQGAGSYFESSLVNIGILHFPCVNTDMIKDLNIFNCLEPDSLAEYIIEIIRNKKINSYYEFKQS